MWQYANLQKISVSEFSILSKVTHIILNSHHMVCQAYGDLVYSTLFLSCPIRSSSLLTTLHSVRLAQRIFLRNTGPLAEALLLAMVCTLCYILFWHAEGRSQAKNCSTDIGRCRMESPTYETHRDEAREKRTERSDGCSGGHTLPALNE
jgi:hypothetical protein